MILSTIFENIGSFFKNNASSLIATICIIISLLLVYLLSKIFLNRYKKKHENKNKNACLLANTIMKCLFYILILLTIIIVLYVWGVNVIAILIGISIILVAFLFGAHKLIYDLINGMCIILGNYYEVDDIIQIDDFKGKVIEITPRITKIINWKNEIRIINNGKITTVTNYSKAPSVDLIELEIARNEDVDKVISLLEESLVQIKDSFKQIIEGPYVTGITKITEKGYKIGIITKTEPEKQYEVERALYKFLRDFMIEEGIKTPE